MNIAIISEQITLQCSIAAGGVQHLGPAWISAPLPDRKLHTPQQLIYVEIRSWHERFL
ncbi:hypothetical protein LN461_05495 [Xanthomonas arboricola]|uniref:hypothetical protein n=1 Tax=Xanthomonas arboricola TaxID=56448 RepID=UPI001E5215F2|nr:hypothetical protein [Xanthomonas arboricola]MCC8668817.1 hypothetical protein [Xanthomonas arboricola]